MSLGPASPQRPRSSLALILLVSGLIGALGYFARSAFIPVGLAILFALLLSSPVEALHRRGLPRSVSALLILAIFLGVVGGTVNFLWEPAQKWLAAAPHTSLVIQRKLGPVARVMHRIDIVTNRAGHLTDAGSAAGGGTASPAAKVAATPSDSDGLLAETRAALVAAVTVIILTLFLLAAGPPVLARMTAAFASDAHAGHALRVIEAVRSEVGRYYATIALINLGLGAATFGAMMALGMPNPLLWGVLAGVLNFIPYVGSATTLLVLAVVALVSFDGAERVLAVAGSYLALATIEGQIVQPLFVGRRLELSPIIVFLALWFGGWFWGVAGVVLAIPSLVALKVAAEHSKQGAPLLAFLSPGTGKQLMLGSVGLKGRQATKKPSAAPANAE
ncbi:MAG TPA: AI-2E family transporter [Steroidobacteraceae bacterium]|jgi:predicted PurR-regulated permease PerM